MVKKETIGTHIPVLKAVLKCFEPVGILELGTGEKSTLLFYKYGHEYGKEVVSIETDIEWFVKIRSLLKPRVGFELLYHDIGHGIHRKSRNIPKNVIRECLSFYYKVLNKHPELSFLFIDHITGLRMPALVGLFDKFDFIAYHDTQAAGYHYDKFDSIDSSQYWHLSFQRFKVWTDVLIHEKYENKFNEFSGLL